MARSRIAASLARRYGEGTAATFAADVGVASRTVQYYAQTYRVFEMRPRVRILGFTHHRIAARSEDPQRAIEEAADKLLSTRQMEVRVEAEALPPEERRLVIRAAEERRFTGEEARRLVGARIEKMRKASERQSLEPGAPEESLPATVLPPSGEPSLAGAELADHLPERASEETLTSEIDEDVEDIMEVCPYCESASSAWTRRPPDEPTS